MNGVRSLFVLVIFLLLLKMDNFVKVGHVKRYTSSNMVINTKNGHIKFM